MVSRIDQNGNDTLILAKIPLNAYVWHVWAERNARIFKKVTLPYGYVVQHIIQIVTTKILYLDLILPHDIQCHWNVPVHTPVMAANLVNDRPSRWRFSVTTLPLSLVGILWRDTHHPWRGRRVQSLQLYDGLYQLFQLVPPDISSITIETDTALQRILLNPAKSNWKWRFKARRLHAVVTSFGHVQSVHPHPQTVRFSKVISRFPGPPLLNVDNIDLLYHFFSAQL